MTDKSFAQIMFDYHMAESAFTDALCDSEFGDFNRISGDYYDNSLEIKEVDNDARLNEAAQKIIYDAGFAKVYVNHKDGWETHYSWNHGQPFKIHRGWRRRYVYDNTVATTNQIGADEVEHRGYYEISFWPEGWGDQKNGRTAKWLKTGYMRIVPDPLDTSKE